MGRANGTCRKRELQTVTPAAAPIVLRARPAATPGTPKTTPHAAIRMAAVPAQQACRTRVTRGRPRHDARKVGLIIDKQTRGDVDHEELEGNQRCGPLASQQRREPKQGRSPPPASTLGSSRPTLADKTAAKRPASPSMSSRRRPNRGTTSRIKAPDARGPKVITSIIALEYSPAPTCPASNATIGTSKVSNSMIEVPSQSGIPNWRTDLARRNRLMRSVYRERAMTKPGIRMKPFETTSWPAKAQAPPSACAITSAATAPAQTPPSSRATKVGSSARIQERSWAWCRSWLRPAPRRLQGAGLVPRKTREG